MATNKHWLVLLLPALPVCAKELAIGGQWQLDSKQAGSGSSDSTQFWVGYERETQVGLIFADGQAPGWRCRSTTRALSPSASARWR